MPAPGEPANGFTLLEMLVVLAILGLIGGLVYPALGRGARAQALAAATATATAALADARAAALRQDRAVALTASPAGVGIAGGPLRALPTGVTAATAPPRGILFLPDGTSGGGDLRLAAGTVTRRLRIAPSGLVDDAG